MSDLRFYTDLAGWWPLISPPEEYVEEAAYVAGLLAAATLPVHDVLELGSGGGHNAVHLKVGYTMVLTDLAEEMLEASRRLNPECEHIQGDMRSLRLGRRFDAVFVHDAVDYMTTENDLRRAIETAFVHCRDGATALFVPDATVETFEADTALECHDGDDGRAVRFMIWTYDPDPADTSIVTEYSFLLRSPDGTVEAVHETHHLGLFDRATWLRLLAEAGFDARHVIEVTTEDRTPRDVFVAIRPEPA